MKWFGRNGYVRLTDHDACFESEPPPIPWTLKLARMLSRSHPWTSRKCLPSASDGEQIIGGIDYDRRNLIGGGSVVGYRSKQRPLICAGLI